MSDLFWRFILVIFIINALFLLMLFKQVDDRLRFALGIGLAMLMIAFTATDIITIIKSFNL